MRPNPHQDAFFDSRFDTYRLTLEVPRRHHHLEPLDKPEDTTSNTREERRRQLITRYHTRREKRRSERIARERHRRRSDVGYERIERQELRARSLKRQILHHMERREERVRHARMRRELLIDAACLASGFIDCSMSDDCSTEGSDHLLSDREFDSMDSMDEGVEDPLGSDMEESVGSSAFTDPDEASSDMEIDDSLDEDEQGPNSSTVEENRRFDTATSIHLAAQGHSNPFDAAPAIPARIDNQEARATLEDTAPSQLLTFDRAHEHYLPSSVDTPSEGSFDTSGTDVSYSIYHPSFIPTSSTIETERSPTRPPSSLRLSRSPQSHRYKPYARDTFWSGPKFGDIVYTTFSNRVLELFDTAGNKWSYSLDGVPPTYRPRSIGDIHFSPAETKGFEYWVYCDSVSGRAWLPWQQGDTHPLTLELVLTQRADNTPPEWACSVSSMLLH